MELRERIVLRLDKILEMLASPSHDELAVGWDENRVRIWTNIFATLRHVVAEGKPLAGEYKNTFFMRGLDMQGICSGEISDLAGQVEIDLRALVAEEERATKGGKLKGTGPSYKLDP